MDDFKLSTISQSVYDEVEAIVESGKYCFSAKDAENFVREIKHLSIGVPERCALKMCEVANCLSEYCKRNADRSRTLSNLNNALFVLKKMVE